MLKGFLAVKLEKGIDCVFPQITFRNESQFFLERHKNPMSHVKKGVSRLGTPPVPNVKRTAKDKKFFYFPSLSDMSKIFLT